MRCRWEAVHQLASSSTHAAHCPLPGTLLVCPCYTLPWQQGSGIVQAMIMTPGRHACGTRLPPHTHPPLRHRDGKFPGHPLNAHGPQHITIVPANTVHTLSLNTYHLLSHPFSLPTGCAACCRRAADRCRGACTSSAWLSTQAQAALTGQAQPPLSHTRPPPA